MSRNLGWIRQFHRPPANEQSPRPLLLVFPHAGGGASAYRKLSQTLSPDFEVLLFQYPGRQDRAREETPATLSEFAAGAFAEFRSSEWAERSGAGPALFGHSMGTIIAFEFARLAEAAGMPVSRLFASSTAAPWLRGQLPPHPQDDEEILARLATMNGTAAAVMQSDEMMRLAVPVIKQDYAAINRYTCSREVRLRTKVHLFVGADDSYVPKEDLLPWADHTEQELALTEFSGGHFFVDANVDSVADAVRDSLRQEPVRA